MSTSAPSARPRTSAAGASPTGQHVRPQRDAGPHQGHPTTAPGHIKVIYFNDPVLIKEGLTTWFAGHDDHLHVRYCEKTHPFAQVRLLGAEAGAARRRTSLIARRSFTR